MAKFSKKVILDDKEYVPKNKKILWEYDSGSSEKLPSFIEDKIKYY